MADGAGYYRVMPAVQPRAAQLWSFDHFTGTDLLQHFFKDQTICARG